MPQLAYAYILDVWIIYNVHVTRDWGFEASNPFNFFNIYKVNGSPSVNLCFMTIIQVLKY